MDSVPLARDERASGVRFGHAGALELARLGVHTSFQDRGLGSHAVFFARELAEAAGCRYVTVDAKPDLASWYGRLGFRRNRLHQEERIKEAAAHRRDPEKIAVSMRYDLHEIPESLQTKRNRPRSISLRGRFAVPLRIAGAYRAADGDRRCSTMTTLRLASASMYAGAGMLSSGVQTPGSISPEACISPVMASE